MLTKWVRGFFVETTIDRSRIFRSAFFVGFGRGHHNILTHFGTEHLRLPSEGFGVESGHPILVFVGHFKVYDWVHIFPFFPPKGKLPGVFPPSDDLAPGISYPSLRITRATRWVAST